MSNSFNVPRFFIFIPLLLPAILTAGNYNFNEHCQTAYHHLFSLRPDAGKQLLITEKKTNPENLIPLLLENFHEFLNIHLTENESQLSAFKSNKNNRVNTCKKGAQNSPWFRFLQAEMHLQYAFAAFQFREYWSGMMDLRRAYILLAENINLYPEFKPAQKSFFTIKALLGVVPEKYHFGLRLVGMSGSLNEGMNGLQNLSRTDWGKEKFLKDEAIHVYVSLLLHLQGDKNKARENFENAGYPIDGNLYSYYTGVKIALYSHHNEEAINYLKNIPEGIDYLKIPVLDYYRGITLLNQLKPEGIQHFQKFIKSNQSGHLIKSAYQKIAWSFLLEGNHESYAQQMQLLKSNGKAETDDDRQAQKEAENNVPPQPDLLKARLLFDGGYFKNALNVLENLSPEVLKNPEYSLEQVYRQARIYDAMKEMEKAVQRYEWTIERGKNAPYYYAANAALQLALYYESKGNLDEARKYFKQCLELDNHEYKNSLGQKAKAGLERVGKG